MSNLDAIQLIEDEYINNSKYLQLKQELEQARAEEQAKVIEVIKRLIKAFEIDSNQFCGSSRKSSSPVAPKYRNTVTGQTWSGRGRKPVSYIENPEQWVEV